jgi:hypothetical protein
VNDDIEIELSTEAGNWRDLRGVPGVLSIEQGTGGSILLHLAPGANVEHTSHEVLTRLLSSGNRVRSFRPASPSLDQLYLKYVGEGDTP